jgi:hypothetical protein
MEPTLVAVLAVPSVQKLELIGDHRQLPAFVQNCWFGVAGVHPTLKKSLFERLIEEGVSTVLSEQRRMRPEIASITRPHYSDVVTIIDNPKTVEQRVGDVAIRCATPEVRTTLLRDRDLWSARGVNIPGLAHNVFFWDLAVNSETRPTAGLSACNATEADAAVGLVRYFLDCGVSPSSITVITPYKGQKNMIIKGLRKVPGALQQAHTTTRSAPANAEQPAPPQPCTYFAKHGKCRFEAKCKFAHVRQPSGGAPGAAKVDGRSFARAGAQQGATSLPSVMVSTVDRYQGDENDIVILSTVRVNPGNRFVGLLNRCVTPQLFQQLFSCGAIVQLLFDWRAFAMMYNGVLLLCCDLLVPPHA